MTLPPKIESWSGENKKIAQSFITKLKSFSNAPLNKNHGLRLLPFIESKPLVDLVADVIKDYGLRLLPDSASHWCDIVGYYYCVDLLALYVFKQKEDFEGILSILGNEVEKEIACRKLKIERGGKDNGVMLRIFRFYEKDMSAFAGLIVKLNSP